MQTSPGYGWSTKFNDALADDLLWVATGSSPVAGTYEGKRGVPGKDHQASGRPPAVMAQACGGEHRRGRRHSMRSVSWRRSSCANFDMQYCWVIRLRDGLIAHVTGYYDSVKMTALFHDKLDVGSAETSALHS